MSELPQLVFCTNLHGLSLPVASLQQIAPSFSVSLSIPFRPHCIAQVHLEAPSALPRRYSQPAAHLEDSSPSDSLSEEETAVKQPSRKKRRGTFVGCLFAMPGLPMQCACAATALAGACTSAVAGRRRALLLSCPILCTSSASSTCTCQPPASLQQGGGGGGGGVPQTSDPPRLTQQPAAAGARRLTCTNCSTHQTPQWRCGPQGPRTLCNACGVRYKKGLPMEVRHSLLMNDAC